MPAQEPKTVLLDADGVIQRPPSGWFARIAQTLPEHRREDLKPYLRALYLAEKPALDGSMSLLAALQDLIAEWGIEDIDGLLGIWHDIHVDPAVIQVIEDARAAGHRVCLATNQHDHRTGYMREIYADVFDVDFYSSELGAAKPDAAYFEAIMARLDKAPDDLVFFDDNEANIASAQALGIESILVTANAAELIGKRLGV